VFTVGERAAGELAALLAGRSATRAKDPFEEPTPFEQLLRGEA
jgi:FMN reductase